MGAVPPEGAGECLPGVHRLPVAYGSRALYQHVLVGSRYAVLVDSGVHDTPATILAPYVRGLGLPAGAVRLLLVTHADADHVGGNAAVRALFPGCLIAAHAADQPWVANPEQLIAERYGEFGAHGQPLAGEQAERLARMAGQPTPVDLVLSGGEALDLGAGQQWQVLHVPGHTPGHLALWHEARRAAIITDAALGGGVPALDDGPTAAPTYRHVQAYMATLARLEALEIDWLLTAHFPLMQGAAVARFFDESRTWVEQAQTALAQVLDGARQPLCLAEIIPLAAPALGGLPEAAWGSLAYPLLGGLEQLQAEGRAARSRAGGTVTWQARSG